MVVKCVKTSIDSDNPNVINNNLEEYLKVGFEYAVYGVRVSDETDYFMIFDDGHLIEVPSQMFEIIQGKVSPLWVIRNDGTKGLTLWPELFYENDFFENFSEWEEKERKQFDELRQLFEESKDTPH
jgi:hypothetical protein